MAANGRTFSLGVKLFFIVNAVIVLVTGVGLAVDITRQYRFYHRLMFEELTKEARVWRQTWIGADGKSASFHAVADRFIQPGDAANLQRPRYLMIVQSNEGETLRRDVVCIPEKKNIDPELVASMLEYAGVQHAMTDIGDSTYMMISLPVLRPGSMQPDGSGEHAIQYVVVAENVDRLNEMIRTEVISRVGFAMVMMLWILVIVNLVLARWVARPVQGLTVAAGRLGRREYDHEIPTDWGTREINELAGSFEQAREMLNHAELVRMADLARARRTQTALLPSLDTPIPGLEVVGHYKPADHIGGDFYDVQLIGNGRVLVLIGDATGHGIAAALMMAMIKMDLIHLVGQSGTSIGGLVDLARELNTDLLAVSEPVDFVSLFVLDLDLADGSARWINAGHIPGQLLRADGTLESLDATGPLIGILGDDVDWPEESAVLHPGDRLVLTTDGLMEVENEKGEPYGLEHLADVLIATADHTPQQVVDRLEREVDIWAGRDHLSDDVTILLVDYKGLGNVSVAGRSSTAARSEDDSAH